MHSHPPSQNCVLGQLSQRLASPSASEAEQRDIQAEKRYWLFSEEKCYLLPQLDKLRAHEAAFVLVEDEMELLREEMATARAAVMREYEGGRMIEGEVRGVVEKEEVEDREDREENEVRVKEEERE